MILWQKIVASQHYSYLNTSVQYWHIWATVASVMHVYGCNSHDKGGGGGGGGGTFHAIGKKYTGRARTLTREQGYII